MMPVKQRFYLQFVKINVFGLSHQVISFLHAFFIYRQG